jgi:uncharacterized membrane protein YraQ (UPF0718 family)
MTNATVLRRPANPLAGIVIFIVIATAGLFYVKWMPYFNRAFIAASNHSIGSSILMGKNATPPAPSLQAALDYAMAYGKAIWQAMVLGLLLGSALQALLPSRWVSNTLGAAGFRSVAVGGLMGLPTMMCTCCAAPVVSGLRKRQASPGGALAFWLGNTVLNPATLIFIGFVLGWNWAALRLCLGAMMVFGLGFVANKMASASSELPTNRVLANDAANASEPLTSFREVLARWMRILFAMTLRLVPEYIILVLLLGAARAWLFPSIGPEISNSVLWILALAVAGTLFVIPTAGEVPIIQAMLALGMAAGPAGALLMTLPPISVPSVAMLGRAFSPRVLIVVTLGVIGFGILGGLLASGLGF